MSLFQRFVTWMIGSHPMPEFTPRAQQSLAVARKVAAHRQQPEVGGDDLLAALCALGAGSAFEALVRSGAKPAEILTRFRVSDGWQKATAPANFAYGNSVKKTLALGIRMAKSKTSTYVGTNHLLLALFDPRSGNAHESLQTLGISRGTIEQKLAEIEREPRPPQTEG